MGHKSGKRKRKSRGTAVAGTNVVWPQGVEAMYDISPWTRWRWEKIGRLPPRDVNLKGKTGWKPETLAAAERPAAA
jgi:hypothetical protein